MKRAYVAVLGPFTAQLETKPFEHNPELTIQENERNRLANELKAAQEVLKILGFQIVNVDI